MTEIHSRHLGQTTREFDLSIHEIHLKYHGFLVRPCYASGVVIIIATLLGHVAFIDACRARTPRRRGIAAVLVVLLFAVVAHQISGSLDAQKTVSRLLMPAGLLLQLLWAAFIWDLCRKVWTRAALSFAILIFFLIAGAKAVGTHLVAQLESEVEGLSTKSSTTAFDAVFVLGGGTYRAPDGQIELGRSGDRLRLAAALYHQGRTQQLITSGHSFTDGRDLSAETAVLWTQIGIPQDVIRRVPEPVNTSQEMQALADIARTEDWGRIGIVTSAWHLPRAMSLAHQAGLTNAIPLPANHLVDPVGPAPVRDWLPTAAGFRQSEVWMWEHLGRSVGR